MDPATLILLVIAILVGLKLRSVLGQQDDDDDGRPMDGYGPRDTKSDTGRQPQRAQSGDDNVVTLPTRDGQGGLDPHSAQKVKKSVNMADQISKFAKKGSPLEKALQEVVAADKSFEPEEFLNGAKTAYEMIVMAFAEGNRKLLKQLLAKEVFEGFSGALDAREKKNLIVDSSFIGIDKADIVSAELRNGRTARITVKFISSLITATHTRDGDVVEGDPKKVREVTDIWTFARDTKARDPNWQLVATESACLILKAVFGLQVMVMASPSCPCDFVDQQNAPFYPYKSCAKGVFSFFAARYCGKISNEGYSFEMCESRGGSIDWLK